MKLFLATTVLFLSSTAFSSVEQDFAESLRIRTVKVLGERSGGTGTIIKSTPQGSYIITNRHVCELTRGGGKVVGSVGEFQVDSFKASEVHDLCVVKVNANLGINTLVAAEEPSLNTEVTVSGHPFLMPTMAMQGNISGNMTIQIMLGVEKCTKEDFESHLLACVFLGGLPIIKTLETTTTTALIAPGNSGSSVFNSDGEIVALVFAGYGRGYSQGILVPYAHVRAFLDQEFRTLKWVKANNTEIMGRNSNSKRGKTSNNTAGTGLKNIRVFPSIVSEELDSIYIRMMQCEADQVCSLNR